MNFWSLALQVREPDLEPVLPRLMPSYKSLGNQPIPFPSDNLTSLYKQLRKIIQDNKNKYGASQSGKIKPTLLYI